ncbi:hypothetical protein B566_EDAN016205 [Ephemera danica]|nr:hypothetical protein B566_EDAN016205 [Ephemera danica]
MRTALVVVCFTIFTAVTASQEPAPRLNDGPIAERTQFKWHVKVQPVGLNVFFGGFLIDPLWVVTCAACANKASDYNLGLGYFNLSDPSEAGRIDVMSANISLHPDFVPNKFNENNIALIQLATPITTSPYVDLLRLPAAGTNDTFLDWLSRTSGFGSGPEGTSQVMRYADLMVVEDSLCPGLVNPGQMCASPVAAFGPCEDEGTALTYVESDGLPTAIGVFSYGFADGPCPGPTSFFTRVTTYLDWITSVTGVTRG